MDEVVIAYDDVTDSEIKSLLEEDLNEFKLDINRLNQFCNEMLSKNDKLFEKLDNTEWKKKRIAIQNKYVSVMQNLQDNGSYRPEKAKKFIPLSNASAGQKTTTILTFLLAYGNQPLLLDQPEDDLDNRLVYDLIVARLKVAKSKRQIIVVTHNANIPVNGDSEYIISMDSETDIIQVNQTGTMDDESMRQEICDVMEGTKDAFEMRAKKYHFNIKE